jgi:hypothetical protein
MTTLPPSTTDGRPEDEDDQYLEPPTDACPAQPRQILVSATLIRSAIDSLEHVEKFFRRYTNPSVRDDLRASTPSPRAGAPGPTHLSTASPSTASGLARAIDTAGPEGGLPHTT